MKCLCGYEYEEEQDYINVDFQGRQFPVMKVVKGDEMFINLGKVTGETKGSKYYKQVACPKCGAVKLII